MSRSASAPAGPPGKQPDAKKSRSFGKQIMPTLIMIALLATTAIVYMGVRDVRKGDEESISRQKTLPMAKESGGGLKITPPEGWKVAKQGGVSGASSRYAIGPRHATKQAFFVTNYPLTKAASNAPEQVRKEAEASLKGTGASGKLTRLKDVDVDHQNSWVYKFRQGSLTVRIWLTLIKHDKKSVLYQFSCQSARGNKGNAMRSACKKILSSVQIP